MLQKRISSLSKSLTSEATSLSIHSFKRSYTYSLHKAVSASTVFTCIDFGQCIVRFEMKVTHEWLLYEHFWPFFTFCTVIFHKTEIQTVILRHLTSLNLNWFKSNGLRCSLRPNTVSANLQKLATDKWPF